VSAAHLSIRTPPIVGSVTSFGTSVAVAYVEEDGFAGGPSSGALVGHCHDRNRSFDLSACLAALVWT